MKIETRKIQHADGRLEVRRIFADENMGDWEYKVVPFGEVAATELEKKLNQLGSDRWQCFWVEANGKSKVFYFKRTKLSYINKIPAADLLRLLRDSDE